MKDQTRVLKTAMPLYLNGTNRKAVLVVHGYTGYPGEMYEVSRRINEEGYSVALPRLPGHGTNGRDFRKTGWKLWYNHIRNEYLNLAASYEEVSVVGLSMGGVLSLILAAEFSPRKVVLLAPAMAVRKKIMHLTPILKIFIPYIRRKLGEEAETDGDRQVLQHEYWSYYFTAQFASLNKLMRIAKKGLAKILCPVYIMLSEKDCSVPLESGILIETGVRGPVEKMILKNSPHVFFDGPEKDLAIDKVIEWLNEDGNK